MGGASFIDDYCCVVRSKALDQRLWIGAHNEGKSLI